MGTDSVSAIVVNYRTPALTLGAAGSALESGAAHVVVVDNDPHGPIELDVQGLEESRVTIIRNARNEGFGTAVNIGARHADGDILLMLNSDAVITREAMDVLISEVARLNHQAIVGPRLLEPDGKVQRSAGLLPGRVNLVIRALGIHRLGARLGGAGGPIRTSRLAREYASAETATGSMTTTMVSGACFAIGRNAFEKLGGFDERFFMYFEDADLCKRAAAVGMPIRYVPSAVVTHIGGASSEGDYHFSPMHARSMRQYLEKWWGLPGAALAIVLLWLRLIGHALVLHPGTGKAFAALRAALRP